MGQEKIVQLLLEHGAYANGKGGWHKTALHAISKEGHKGIVRLLLENSTKRQWDYEIALYAASREGYEAIM